MSVIGTGRPGIGRGQSLRLLAAPLRVETTFTPAEPVFFQELVFPAGKPIDSTYAFNTRWRDLGFDVSPETESEIRRGARPLSS